MVKNLEKKLKMVNIEILDDSKTTLSHIRGHINAWDPLHFTNLISKFGFKLEKYIPSEGIPFPMKKPFKPYWRGWISRLKRFRNLSYNMHFLLTKIRNVKVGNYD
ncbi:MAG: hypothetical protein JXA68_00100, partial [Ignavibacteriales bacterium]|nr:hypothetical protein [Ignavibacteriales bacterium]